MWIYSIVSDYLLTNIDNLVFILEIQIVEEYAEIYPLICISW